jgi:hypothetical protein
MRVNEVRVMSKSGATERSVRSVKISTTVDTSVFFSGFVRRASEDGFMESKFLSRALRPIRLAVCA